MSSSLRALNRFGLGARPGEADRLGDPRGWLLGQLAGAPPARSVPAGAASAEIEASLSAFRRLQRSEDRAARAAARRRLVLIAVAESASTLEMRATSERPFAERLIAFWGDHLCVSVGSRLLVGPLAGSYERDVIRANALGTFEAMVLASARHPAMLVYLDNAQSVGPRSQAAQRASGRRELGLNENYARELLELHTLGVGGGYTQADVTELARLLTGWTTDGIAARGVPAFRFVAIRNEPGRKTILGERYGEGEREGERAIRAFCRHPATAKHIATKLATHFVADTPPASAVARLEQVFRESGGDLRELARALVALPECWDERNVKFRAPQDWLVAVMRAAGARQAGENLLNVLRQLRQPMWSPQSPKGFGDLQREWADPDSLLNRAELARTIARRAGNAAPGAARGMAARGVGISAAAPRALATVVPDDAALAALLADDEIPAAERAAIAFASPAFQWR
ncbi:MAG: DUF1800 domain-containing protein [Gemmatimonadaceae bacterium]